MNTFFCRLVPPRPSFTRDMSAAEAQAMREHAAYWRACMEKSQVVVFGLVADPAAPFGIAILEVADEQEALRLTARDPALGSVPGLRYEVCPMPLGAVHPFKGPA